MDYLELSYEEFITANVDTKIIANGSNGSNTRFYNVFNGYKSMDHYIEY